MKINKKATSVAEAIILMMIVVTGVTGMYKVYMSSMDLQRATSNKVIAINIAREAIEAMTNIRDTNWILFSSDTSNCWNTYNYNNLCVGNNLLATDIDAGSYIIYKNNLDRWILTGSINTIGYSDSDYRTQHRVGIDSDGFYTQTQTGTTNNLVPLFTREIKIEYPEDTNGDGLFDSNDEKMKVTSLVQWQDNTSTSTRKVELIQTLSNWKK